MPNQIDTRRMIPVSPDTHKELKILSVNEDKTFDEMVEKLLESYKMFKKLDKCVGNNKE